MYPFLYKIKFFAEKTTCRTEEAQCGMLYAKNWADAAQQLGDWYGEDYLSEINFLLPLCDDPVILPSEIVDKIARDEYAEYYEGVNK